MGNAVPPIIAKAIAKKIAKLSKNNKMQEMITMDVSADLILLRIFKTNLILSNSDRIVLLPS